jgi:hypothetical protein
VSTFIPEQPPSRRWHPTWEDYNADSASNDSLVSDLEVRIIALEEAVASRRARRRLARSIRRAHNAYQWAGSFFAARLESTTHEWLNGPRWLAEVRKGRSGERPSARAADPARRDPGQVAEGQAHPERRVPH